MASKEGEQGQQGGDNIKRRKIAHMEVSAMVTIHDVYAHAINDEALLKWHRVVQAARNKCKDEMIRAGSELARSCTGTWMQTPVDNEDSLQRHTLSDSSLASSHCIVRHEGRLAATSR